MTLRNGRERAIFKIQEGIGRGFRESLYAEHYTEIHTPKIAAAYHREIRDKDDFEPEEERLLCELIRKRTGS